MNSKRRKALLVLLAVIMAFGFQTMPLATPFGIHNEAYGNIRVKSQLTGKISAVQGDENVVVTVEVENKDSEEFTFDSATLGLEYPNNITVSGGSTGTVTLTKGQKVNLIFYLDIGRFASANSRALNLVLRNDGISVHENLSLGMFRIYQKLGTPPNDSGSVAVLDISHTISPEGGFASGQDNTLMISVQNYGNTVIKNAELSLTLPEGLSIYNASNSASLGSMSTDSSREASFPIIVDDDAVTKNYAITAKLTGLKYSNESVSEEKTFYIPVNGTGISVKNAEITNISIPSQVTGQEEFSLNFDIHNQNSADLKNVKVNVDIPEGLLNKTRSEFIESAIPAGNSKSYGVTLFAADDAEEKAYPIKISLSSSTAKEDTADVIQYASVYVNGISGAKTPQLMVDSYSYGGSFVQAGDEFVLNLGLYNTSETRSLSNIKVTVSSEDGTFIPVDSSNAFYIDKLGKKEHAEQSLRLSTKPGAEQKTTSLNVEMAYEDGSGNPFTSKDVISIPVMQETRLEVDDVIAPPELYAGMQSGVSVQFYNMGKTVLNNLRVTAEGDFDTPESTSYFVGNMESGKSDSYDFSFIPRNGGTMEGKIIFTYEDASGEEQMIERPFDFEVMEEMPAFDDEMLLEDMEEGTGGKLPWIIGGIVVCLAAIGIFIWRKIRKKKINREMEIDE